MLQTFIVSRVRVSERQERKILCNHYSLLEADILCWKGQTVYQAEKRE